MSTNIVICRRPSAARSGGEGEIVAPLRLREMGAQLATVFQLNHCSTAALLQRRDEAN